MDARNIVEKGIYTLGGSALVYRGTDWATDQVGEFVPAVNRTFFELGDIPVSLDEIATAAFLVYAFFYGIRNTH